MGAKTNQYLKTHGKTSKQVVHFKDLSARAKKVARA